MTSNYSNYWTKILDNLLGVTFSTRKSNIYCGAEVFNRPIEKCNIRFLNHLLVSMKLLYTKFVTPAETGDNRFIFQPVFSNNNFTRISKGKKICLLQEEFGVEKKATSSVNQCYSGIIFKTHNELSEIIHFPEGTY